jgi:tRNA(Arg) A34 adenosine deaminase TadA
MSANIHLTHPDWLAAESATLPALMPKLEDRMRAVLRFARLNFERGTGGPFAAGVFERDTGKRIFIGVNRVMPMNCSSAHAEVMALSGAQQLLGTWDIGGKGRPPLELVVNWRPCAMCYGATIWSGVRALVIAGSDRAVEEITGFDEGPLPADWAGELERRGISVRDNVLRAEAIKVFEAFRDSGATVYNGRQG